MIFHEIFGGYYRAAAAVLKASRQETLTKRELADIVRKYAFGESMMVIPEGLQGEKWRILHSDLTTSLRHDPATPLTTLEKRWLKAVLADPRMQLFEPDTAGLEDVEPLFMPDQFVYYDRYGDGDPYSDPEYIARFRTILRALREGQNLYICFGTGGDEERKLSLTPHYLEYSEKDDRFRLTASDRKRRWTINLSRIRQCEPAYTNEPYPLREANMASVTFELEDRRKAMERVLLHFSHLEKETKRLDDKHYRVTLRYDRQDETEMVIRILSFGSAICVTEPEYFISQIRKRIDRQRSLMNHAPDDAKTGKL